MKIAFCGDSYCAAINNEPYPSWPYLVAKEFDAKILCSGQGGGCLFYAYETMMKNINDADYIIFCITEPHRLASRYKTSYDVDMISAPVNNNEDTAAKYYFKYLWDWNYHTIAHRGLLREIELEIEKYNKKCIFLKCFSHSFCDYTPQNVIWGDVNLTEVSNMDTDAGYKTKYIGENGEEGYGEMPIGMIGRQIDDRLNHFVEETSKYMANFIIDVIKKDDFTPGEIQMGKYFNYEFPNDRDPMGFDMNTSIKWLKESLGNVF
jgi:hypothetical protein